MKNKYKVNEEAVKKIAERVYDNGSTVINRNDLEEMFPALKESEDEKIMKCIEDLIKENTFSNIYGVTKDDCLTWLEKQGEQKPVEWSEEIPTDLKDIVDNEANAIWKEESSDGCHLVIDSFNMFYGICMQVAEAVVDYQKPAAWSEEDEARFKSCIKILQPSDGYDTINTKWLKFLKERVLPKHEWTEDDEYYRGIILYCLDGVAVGNLDKKNAISWFKSLCPQKQCQIDGVEMPKSLNIIFKAIDKAKEELRKGNNGAALEALCIQYPAIPFAIQKQWKPSEEQIIALKLACSYGDDDNLKLLLEQLKAL